MRLAYDKIARITENPKPLLSCILQSVIEEQSGLGTSLQHFDASAIATNGCEAGQYA